MKALTETTSNYATYSFSPQETLRIHILIMKMNYKTFKKLKHSLY